MTLTEDLTQLYGDRLLALRDVAANAVADVWETFFDLSEPAETLAMVGTSAAQVVTRAQAGALAETTNWLRALLRGAGDDGENLPTPSARVGQMISGNPISDMASLVPSAFFARIGEEWEPEAAAESTRAYVDRIARSEPYAIANRSTLDIMSEDDRFLKRYSRITHPDACKFCSEIASRGYIEVNAGFPAHNDCKCRIGPEVDRDYLMSPRAIRQREARARRAFETPEWQRQRRWEQQARRREVNRRRALELSRARQRAEQGLR